MLSNRVVVAPGGVVRSNNNENLANNNKSTNNNKTPAPARRALGDISNRKKHVETAAANVKSSIALAKSAKKAPPSAAVVPTATTKTPFRRRDVAVNEPRRVEFDIPKQQTDAPKRIFAKTPGTKHNQPPREWWHNDEPERAAGRTYAEQLMLEDDNDDDYSDIVPLEGMGSLRKDWMAFEVQRRERYEQLEKEEIEKHLREFEEELDEFEKKAAKGMCVVMCLLFVKSSVRLMGVAWRMMSSVSCALYSLTSQRRFLVRSTHTLQKMTFFSLPTTI